MGSFRLRKWYLDLLTEEGEAVIAYWGYISWSGLSGCIAGVLTGPREVTDLWTTHVGPEPRLTSDGLTLRADRLHLDLEMRGRHRPVPTRLYSSGDGVVTWTPFFLNAEARCTIRERVYVGRGYAECLEMTIPPWKLPLRSLMWGHALLEEESLTWIRWTGSHELELVADEEGVRENTEISETTIRGATSRVELAPSGVLRDGTLAQTLLGVSPLVQAVCPTWLKSTHERKCVHRATCGAKQGWAIAEVVRFPGVLEAVEGAGA